MAGVAADGNDAGMRRNYTRAERDELIRGVTRRREPVPAAAAKLGVSVSTAYGWVRAARARLSETSTERPLGRTPEMPTFVQLVPAAARDASFVLRVGEVEIEVRAGFDAALLRSIIEVLQGGEA
jgi:transposase-like protein